MGWDMGPTRGNIGGDRSKVIWNRASKSTALDSPLLCAVAWVECPQMEELQSSGYSVSKVRSFDLGILTCITIYL